MVGFTGLNGSEQMAWNFLSQGTDDDDLVKVVAAFRAKFREALQQYHDKSQAELADARAKIEKAKSLIQELGIDSALTDLWEEVQHYLTWSQREDWQKWNPLGVSDVASRTLERDGRAKTSVVLFNLNGKLWELSHSSRVNYGPSSEAQYGDLELRIDREEVFGISVSRGYEEWERWRYCDVSALSLGEWVPLLVEAQFKLQQRTQTRFAAMEAERISAQAAKIKL